MSPLPSSDFGGDVGAEVPSSDIGGDGGGEDGFGGEGGGSEEGGGGDGFGGEDGGGEEGGGEDGGGGGGGEGGEGGDIRGPQSKQSVPRLHLECIDPGPPSSHSKSLGNSHVFVQVCALEKPTNRARRRMGTSRDTDPKRATEPR